MKRYNLPEKRIFVPVNVFNLYQNTPVHVTEKLG